MTLDAFEWCVLCCAAWKCRCNDKDLLNAQLSHGGGKKIKIPLSSEVPSDPRHTFTQLVSKQLLKATLEQGEPTWECEIFKRTLFPLIMAADAHLPKQLIKPKGCDALPLIGNAEHKRRHDF